MSQIQIQKTNGKKHQNIPIGITNIFRSNSICDSCTISLYTSKWKEKIAVYSLSRKSTQGYYCIKCAIKKGKVTESDFDKFVGYNQRTKQPLDYSNGVY